MQQQKPDDCIKRVRPTAMRRTAARLMTFAAFVALSSAAAAATPEDALELYVEGLRRGDVKTLEKAFFADGQFCRSDQVEIRCSSFAEALPSWVARPDPQARGKVVSKEIVGNSMARVTYELEFNGDSYVDYFLLYKNEDRWIAVAKTTFVK